MTKEFWLYGALAVAMATIPTHLKGRVEMLDGGGNYSTEVLPVVEGEKQYALLAFCDITGTRPGEERWLSAPFATVTIAFPDKKTVWRDTKAANFGLQPVRRPNDDGEYIGLIDRAGISVDELINARRRYPELISLVLERRWLLTRHTVTPEEQATARELQECTRILFDKPLLPFYRHYGSHFLAWMERAAK
jgi:hypothetical protein